MILDAFFDRFCRLNTEMTQDDTRLQNRSRRYQTIWFLKKKNKFDFFLKLNLELFEINAQM